MIDYRIVIGENEVETMISMQLQTPGYVMRRRILRLICAAVALASGGFPLISLFAFGEMNDRGASQLALCAVFLCILFSIKGIQRWQLRRAYKEANPEVYGVQRHYILDDDGITTESPFQKSDYDWDSLDSSRELDGYYFLRLRTGIFLIFRRSDFSPDEYQVLRQLVSSHLPAKRFSN